MSITSSRKKASLGSKKTQKAIKKTFYESPLKHIQLSSKRWEQIQSQKRLIRNVKQAAKNKQSFVSSVENESLQDSIIVLSDNENDSLKQEDENDCKNNKEKKKRSLQQQSGKRQIQYNLNKSSKAIKQEEIEIVAHANKRRKIDPCIVSDNDSSCLVISDIEDSEITIEIDDENIAPSDSIHQGSDDIVVVWSSSEVCSLSTDQFKKKGSGNQLEEGEIKNECEEKETKDQFEKGEIKDECEEKETKDQFEEKKLINISTEQENINDSDGKKNACENDNRVFMIDCNPTLQNLNFLATGEPEPIPCEDIDDDSNDSNLLFNQPGLTLPRAYNISRRIVMEKPKSGFSALKQHLEQQALNSFTASPFASDVDINSLNKPFRKLREIIIDGNNVAMAHKIHRVFSEEGLSIVIDYFQIRGHTVKVFIPQCRRSVHRPLLEKWYKEGIVVFTPSRFIGGRWITSYDDRFILEYATMCEGIVISSDQYRDLYREKPEWRDTIENRLLPPTFVGDIVMFPEDPLGRRGPKLEEFLMC